MTKGGEGRAGREDTELGNDGWECGADLHTLSH